MRRGLLVIDRNSNYSPAAAAAAGPAAAMGEGGGGGEMTQRSRPVRLSDGLSRTANVNNLPQLTIEIHAPADEPVASSCGCMTDLSHHQFHHHHHPPTPHYHGNSDVNESDTEDIGDAAPANDLLSLGEYSPDSQINTT